MVFGNSLIKYVCLIFAKTFGNSLQSRVKFVELDFFFIYIYIYLNIVLICCLHGFDVLDF